MEDTKQEEVFLTLDEAAALLKTNKRHIKRMIQAGKLRAKDISLGQKIRKDWRVLKEDVLKLAS